MFVSFHMFVLHCNTRASLYRAVHVTKVGCASLCEGSNICMSFFFTPGDGQCQLHSRVFDPALYTGSTEPATDVLYYERGESSMFLVKA